jgi:hypothetical protein
MVEVDAADVDAVAALVIEVGGLAGGDTLVAPDDLVFGVIVDEFPAAGVPLLDVNVLELIVDISDESGTGGGISSEIPLLPSTDPVWMLEIGLHGVEVMLVGGGVTLGGVAGAGFAGTCATAAEAHATLLQMNRNSLMRACWCKLPAIAARQDLSGANSYPQQRERYSVRKAITGSILVARLAGSHAAHSATRSRTTDSAR